MQISAEKNQHLLSPTKASPDSNLISIDTREVAFTDTAKLVSREILKNQE